MRGMIISLLIGFELELKYLKCYVLGVEDTFFFIFIILTLKKTSFSHVVHKKNTFNNVAFIIFFMI